MNRMEDVFMLRRHYSSLAFWAMTKREALLAADVESETSAEAASPFEVIQPNDEYVGPVLSPGSDESTEIRHAA
jgi:hypothetical protein